MPVTSQISASQSRTNFLPARLGSSCRDLGTHSRRSSPTQQEVPKPVRASSLKSWPKSTVGYTQQEGTQQLTTPRAHRKGRRRGSDVPVARTRVMSPPSAASVSRRRPPHRKRPPARPRASRNPGSLRRANRLQGALPPSNSPAGPLTLPRSSPPTPIPARTLTLTTPFKSLWLVPHWMKTSNTFTRRRPSFAKATYSTAGSSTLAPRGLCALIAPGSRTSFPCLDTRKSSLATTAPSPP